MKTAIAAHRHGPMPPPDNTLEFTAHAVAVAISEKLTPITGQVKLREFFG